MSEIKKISKNIIFNIFMIFFLFGIFINNYFNDYISSLYLFLFFIIFSLNIIIYSNKIIKFLIYLLFMILWFSLGLFTSNNNLDNVDKKIESLKIYDNFFYNEVTFEIKDTYKIKEFNNEYVAKLLKINNTNFNIKNKKIWLYDHEILWLVTIAKNYKIKKWDIVQSKARISIIKDFNEFEYKNFLLSKWIYIKTYLPFINNIGQNKPNFIIDNIDILRAESLKIIYKIYPKNEAIFLAWILLWARESLPEELKNNFNKSWLTHFIAVSGFNITILILFFSFLFKWLPIFIRTIFITLIIILFTFLVWDTAPVIRASIMWLIAYYVMVSWRQWSIFTILLLTGFIMSIMSPFILNYDVSFALSFLAVFWIVYTQKFWSKIFVFMPETLAIKEAFVLTMSALVFTLPIMLFNFGQVSILAPFANVAITWTIPIAMLLGFISILLYPFLPFLAYIIWYIDWVFLKWDIMVVNFFWTKEYSIFQYDFWLYKNYIEVIYFIILIFIILYIKSKPENYISLDFNKRIK